VHSDVATTRRRTTADYWAQKSSVLPNNRLQAAVGGLGGGCAARWACAHRA
jgi:hypothetical protein